ncbi:unnamed protein product [Brassica oleracea]
MFPKWEFDVEDTPAENIIKLMFVKKPWKWTMDCGEVTAKKNVVKENSPRPRKKARKEAPAEDRVGTCLKEIKYLSERVEAVDKKVGITTKRKGTSSQNTTSPPKPTLEPGVSNESSPNKRLTRQIAFALFLVCQNMCALFIVYGFYILKVLMGRTREGRAWRRIKVQMCPQFCPQMLVPRKIKLQNRALRRMLDIRKRGMLLWHFFVQRVIEQGNLVIIPNKKLYPGYNHFAPIDKKKLKELADWLKTCPHYRTPLDKKSLVYIEDLPRYDVNPQYFRSEIMCFLDHLFAQQWRFNFKDFGDSEPDQNGSGRRLPGGACNYYAGTIPSFCQSNKVWGTDIDDIYAPVNFTDTHWIAMWISINKKHIVVFDSICSIISPEELDVVMEPFVYMVPYLLVECASSDEQRAQYSLEPFTYERPTNIPPARACDCGVYTLKYIECHALGIEFSKKDFAKANGKTMRDKMAVDIFQELPDAHEFENKDNDDNLGAYDG